jgi:transcriptional regulator with XRE-family HTH domain
VADSDSRSQRYDDAVGLLKNARKRAGLTQARLATVLGTRQQFVSKYESKERRLDVIEFCDIADALSLDLEELLRSCRGQR